MWNGIGDGKAKFGKVVSAARKPVNRWGGNHNAASI
jgi:hypothetical protein